ncbi:MAG: site-specific DNA-methyltransferase [Patescibacteria group bacterium]
MKKPQKVNLTSSDLSAERQAEFRRILPEVFIENKIDWNKLKAVLGGMIDERMEKFNFTWAGKSNAIRNVLTPSKLTLKPLKDESIKWDESENIFIEGDNLEALKLLQKAYFEKVKMIYIDPPYNTGGDFVYRDNFVSPLNSYLEQTGQKGEGMSLSTNRETSGRYHSDWLSMMYPRLKLAWNLLKDDGIIFVSIDDNEAPRLRMIMDEIFGEENFISQIVWQKIHSTKNDAKYLSENHEYLLAYSKEISKLTINLLQRTEGMDARYSNPDNDPRGKWQSGDLVANEIRTGGDYEVFNPKNGKVFRVPTGKHWVYAKDNLQKMIEENRVWFGRDGNAFPRKKRFLTEVQQGKKGDTLWLSDIAGHNQEATRELKEIFNGIDVFDTPKPTRLIKLMLQLATNLTDQDIVLDFFAGAGSTAHAVIQQNVEDGGNRKFVLVQLPELLSVDLEAYKAGYKTIAEVCKERIRRVIMGYGNNPEPIDTGFKIFKLDKSNYVENSFELDVERSEEENTSAFKEYLEKAKQQGLFGKTIDLNVIYENIVKEGLSLNSQISKEKIGDSDVYSVTDRGQSLLICLEKKISDGTVKILTSQEYKNRIFICLDSSLSDSSKTNLALNLELKTI